MILLTSRCNETPTTSDDKFAAACFTIILISQLPFMDGRFSRKNSLTRRLSRFRTTAFPTRLVTVIPNRFRFRSFGKKATMKKRSERLRPCFDNWIYADRFSSLSDFFKPKSVKRSNPDKGALGQKTRKMQASAGGCPCLESDRQSFPALRTSPFYDKPALFCGHSL